jgi:hypothetical protein
MSLMGPGLSHLLRARDGAAAGRLPDEVSHCLTAQGSETARQRERSPNRMASLSSIDVADGLGLSHLLRARDAGQWDSGGVDP